MQCTIVIATYNRKELFKRTLKYVKEADYTGYDDINLIISIDRAANCQEMLEEANAFNWEHGKKKVILHAERQGLRKHFIFCGDLSQEYGPVIFLEDDVVVNKYFYQIAQKMTNAYIDDDRIVGVSLYTMIFNETAQRPFVPIEDGSDVFFCSLMSWAPVYFPRQWEEFKKWISKLNGREIVYNNIPQDVSGWPNSSFKKLHIQYMAQNKLYFAYTRHSCATNFSEPGEHYKKATNKLQTSMDMGARQLLNLMPLDESIAVYDAFLELRPERLKRLQPKLSRYSFDVDLYGKKGKSNVTQEYLLTTHKAKSAVLSWGRKMVPHELNIVYDIVGDEIVLAKREDIKYGSKGLSRYKDDVLYDIKGSSVLKIVISDMIWGYAAIKARIKKKQK